LIFLSDKLKVRHVTSTY